MKNNFAIGDCVRLKSGSPLMVISGIPQNVTDAAYITYINPISGRKESTISNYTALVKDNDIKTRKSLNASWDLIGLKN